ncbi:hypothetical protein T08_14415, partial [Trichinella sp. T8]
LTKSFLNFQIEQCISSVHIVSLHRLEFILNRVRYEADHGRHETDRGQHEAEQEKTKGICGSPWVPI